MTSDVAGIVRDITSGKTTAMAVLAATEARIAAMIAPPAFA